jgi:hypothetical protein
MSQLIDKNEMADIQACGVLPMQASQKGLSAGSKIFIIFLNQKT